MAAAASKREVFGEAVRVVLNTWPILQIAVDQGFGGVLSQQKADWMVDVVRDYFHGNEDLQQGEVEDFLSVLLDQEFNTVVEDGSLPQVSEKLCLLFSQCQQGALQQVSLSVAALAQQHSSRSKVTRAPSPEEQEGQEEEMECDITSCSSKPRPPTPPQEEDGWTVVRNRK